MLEIEGSICKKFWHKNCSFDYGLMYELTMRKLSLDLILFFFLFSIGRGQEILLIRTDVDSTRSGFVTATYNFAVKILVQNVERATGISFVLRHNLADYVQFSNYRVFDFGKNGSVFIYPFVNTLNLTESIYFGILTGDTIGSPGYNSPEVAEFEFSVSPQSLNGTPLIFVFEEAQAVVSTDSGGKIETLESKTYTYTIHSFVDVWPGDADNDGIVGIKDISKLGLYLGYGSKKTNFRSFQRKNATTYWIGQSCLAWDSSEVTFSDCDGDGEITLNDMLVIPLNFGKQHSSGVYRPPNEQIVIYEGKANDAIQSSVSKPMILKSDEPISGFALKLENPNQVAEVTKSNALPQNSIFYRKFDDDGNLYLMISSLNSNYSLNNLVVCYFDKTNGMALDAIEVTGISKDGRFVRAFLFEETANDVKTSTNTNNFSQWLEDANFPIAYRVFNLSGILITKGFAMSRNELPYITLLSNYNFVELVDNSGNRYLLKVFK